MKKIILTSLLAVAAMGSVQAADLVTNGSFELGGTGWSFTDTVGFAPVSQYQDCCGINGSGYPSINGNSAAFFGWGQQTGGTLYQTLSTHAGTTYTVNFSYGALAQNQLQTMTVSALNGAAELSHLNVQAYGSYDQPHLVSGYSFQFTANSSSTKLLFSDTSAITNNTDAMIDSVSVMAAVPEPETYAMLVAGLGMIGFLARRRKA